MSSPSAILAHEDVWKQLNSPGPTKVEGISIDNAELVVTAEKSLVAYSYLGYTAFDVRALPMQLFSIGTTAVLEKLLRLPDEFVLKGSSFFFGMILVELYTLQSPSIPGVHQRVTIPGDHSLGKLIPSMASSPIDVSGLISTDPDCLEHVPTPTELKLHGKLEVNINIFGDLDITHLGLEIMEVVLAWRMDMTIRIDLSDEEECRICQRAGI